MGMIMFYLGEGGIRAPRQERQNAVDAGPKSPACRSGEAAPEGDEEEVALDAAAVRAVGAAVRGSRGLQRPFAVLLGLRPFVGLSDVCDSSKWIDWMLISCFWVKFQLLFL